MSIRDASMSWVYVDLPLTVSLEGALHIGTGYDRGLVQRTVVRDAQGDVYVPGSSLKGKARNACEDLARCCGLVVCGLPRVAASLDKNHQPEQCLVCRVFGSPGGNVPTGRALYWADAHLTECTRKALGSEERRTAWQTTVRSQVRLDRARGIAADGLLYTSEFSVPALEFAGRVSGWLLATPCLSEGNEKKEGYYEINLLLAGLRLVAMLGGGRSRGTGACRIRPADPVVVRPEGQAQSVRYPLSDLMKAAEFLALFTEEHGGAAGGT